MFACVLLATRQTFADLLWFDSMREWWAKCPYKRVEFVVGYFRGVFFLCHSVYNSTSLLSGVCRFIHLLLNGFNSIVNGFESVFLHIRECARNFISLFPTWLGVPLLIFCEALPSAFPRMLLACKCSRNSRSLFRPLSRSSPLYERILLFHQFVGFFSSWLSVIFRYAFECFSSSAIGVAVRCNDI